MMSWMTLTTVKKTIRFRVAWGTRIQITYCPLRLEQHTLAVLILILW